LMSVHALISFFATVLSCELAQIKNSQIIADFLSAQNVLVYSCLFSRRSFQSLRMTVFPQ